MIVGLDPKITFRTARRAYVAWPFGKFFIYIISYNGNLIAI